MKKIVGIIFVLCVFVFGMGCLDSQLETTTFRFMIEETREPVDGEVYLGSGFLGFTKNGELEISRDSLQTGEMRFLTENDDGTQIVFFYEIEEVNLGHGILENFLTKEQLEKMTLKFEITDGNIIDGDVYLNENFLGKTDKGSLQVPFERIESGEIGLKGTYDEEIFEFYFDMPFTKTKYYMNTFQVGESDLLKLVRYRDIDTSGLENRIFETLNQERMNHGYSELNQDAQLGKIALELGEFILRWGDDLNIPEFIDDSMALKRIMYNTWRLERITLRNFASEEELMKEIMQNIDLAKTDYIFGNHPGMTDAGVGMYCDKGSCHLCVLALDRVYSRNGSLRKNHYQFFYILARDLDENQKFGAEITVNASSGVDIYIMDDYQQVESVINRRVDSYISRELRSREMTETFDNLTNEHIVVLYNRDSHDSVDFNLRVEYKW